MAEKQPSKNFLLRLDRASMEALERWAADEFRSVNGQLQWIVADALRRAGRAPNASSGVRSDECTGPDGSHGASDGDEACGTDAAV